MSQTAVDILIVALCAGIPLAGIGGWAAIEVAKRKAMAGNNAPADVAKRLDAIDKRLSSIETTLNDIP